MDINNYGNMRLFNSIRRGYRFRDWMEEVIIRSTYNDDRRRQLTALLGIHGHCAGLPASDILARTKAMEIMYRVVREYMHDEVSAYTPKLLGTWTCDDGLTSDRTPHLRVKAFKAKVYQQIHAMGLNAIAVIEIQPITNYPFPGTNTFTMHAHGIAWGDVSREDRNRAIEKTNNSHAWRNHFGSDPVQFKFPVREEGGLLGWVCYMWDNPDYAKRERQWRNGKTSFVNHVKTYPGALAFRVEEGLSHLKLPDLVFGVADGKYVRREWDRELKVWSLERNALHAPEPEFDRHEVWSNLPSAYYRRHGYQPYLIN